jgi:hypothetical protein
MASLWRDLCMAAAREEVYSIALFYGRLAAKAAALAGVFVVALLGKRAAIPDQPVVMRKCTI